MGGIPKEESWVTKINTSRIIFINPNEYFHAAVSGAMASMNVKASEHAQIYLANLLSHYISAENLYPTDAEGKRAETLTEQLAQALEQENSEQRVKRLRQLGDFSLYVAGFFMASLQRKLVDVDYYIGMGGAAYESVAKIEEKRARAELFAEMARKFAKFVEVLAQISEETAVQNKNHQDLLRIYDQWTKTGSDRLAKTLSKAGIVPVARKKTGTGDA